ncbi:hypothetical protein CHISP_3162 [Chitinispirillum alkaliphilum]|nr:hypothetical protein CHISP_3162 [Chitinispirillum alkaliphilum]
MKAENYIANFDSSSVMVRAVANYLKGKEFYNLEMQPRRVGIVISALLGILSQLPRQLSEFLYSIAPVQETFSPKNLSSNIDDHISAYVTSRYEKRCFPAIAIGSSNGAAVHLYSMFGIPWLSQTSLLPVHRFHFDNHCIQSEFEWSRKWGKVFTKSNPHLELHHMIDPVNDMLMSKTMAYFRVKKLRLGAAYEKFISDCLEPGGTIFITDCTTTWPQTQIGERHYFQFGGLGGAGVDEYFNGGERVRKFIQKYSHKRDHWDPPTPNITTCEAEWGFSSELGDDIHQFAKRRGYKVKRIVINEPMDLSPFVADLYRYWYKQRGIESKRLVAESFALLEPWWTVLTGSIPYWVLFPSDPFYQKLSSYLDNPQHRVDEIGVMLLSFGVDAIGLTPIEEWRHLLSRASKRGVFIGVNEKTFPRDFSSLLNYHFDFGKKFQSRSPVPEPAKLTLLDKFIHKFGNQYAVKWRSR